MRLAFVFPGQGSQSLGMMLGYERLPAVREAFSEASDVLKQDLWTLMKDGPADDLNLTTNTQPLMLAAGVGVVRAWSALGGPQAAVMAGHSLGEYTALVAAGSVSFADAVSLVRFRAQAMQEAVPAGTGAMAALLGLDDDAVHSACSEVRTEQEIVEPANFNSPGQVVIAGNKPAVERAIVAAKSRGAKRAMLLPMSVPSHCSLMRPAAERFRERLAGVAISKPLVPVLQNANLAAAADPADVKEALVQQLVRPVRWVETVQKLAADGASHVLELGPGKVLTGLNKRIAPQVQTLALADAPALHAALSSLKS